MNFLLTYTINDMTAEDKKLAEEILDKELSLVEQGWNKRELIIYAMEAYHQAKLSEVTDEDIEAWANNVPLATLDVLVSSIDTFRYGMRTGAKAFRDGKIKHIEK